MRVNVHSEIPESLTAETNGRPNYASLGSEEGVIVHVRGEGSVTVYVELDGAWRSHPQGQDITDDGSFARLMVGVAGRFRVCLVGDATEAYLAEVRF